MIIRCFFGWDVVTATIPSVSPLGLLHVAKQLRKQLRSDRWHRLSLGAVPSSQFMGSKGGL